jgi:hypothetical protein|tara:strand:- start:167 stop:409 length:243 start_codon:yes stop_codon:yes gene_type:complete
MAFVGFQKKPFTKKFKDLGDYIELYDLDRIYRCLSELKKDYDKLSKEGKNQFDFLANYFTFLEQSDYHNIYGEQYDNTRK